MSRPPISDPQRPAGPPGPPGPAGAPSAPSGGKTFLQDTTRSRKERSRALSVGIRRGFVVFLTILALAEAISVGEFALSGGAFHLWSWIKVGFVYLLSFFRVGIRVTAVGPLSVVGGVGPGTPVHPVTYELHLALLAVTGLALWLLFGAGRAAAAAATGPATRVLGAAAAAAAFAVPTFLCSLAVSLRFPKQGVVAVRPDRLEAILLPAGLAVASTMLGAFMPLPPTRAGRSIVASALRGGARMLAFAIAFLFVAFLVTAAANPDATKTYVTALSKLGRGGAFLGAHHVLAIPNQSVLLLAPSLGSCTELRLSSRDDGSALCFGQVEIGNGAQSLFSLALHRGPDDVPIYPPYYLFLLAPGAAVLLGGWSVAGGRRTLSLLVVGAASGVVFAGLVWLASWLATITISNWGFRLGPELPSTALWALVWGVPGGALGAAFARGPQEEG